MKTLIKIFFPLLIVSCLNRQTIPRHSDIFTYFDKKTNDTIKFYGYSDLDSAIFHAKHEKKNILVIFSCWACMAMGNEEWRTLSLYPDLNRLQNNSILLWLPNDDKTIAKDTNQIVYWYNKQRRLKTVGDKNKYFEETIFGQSSQPVFCFMDSLKKPFGKIIGYTKDKNEIESFIDSGLKK